MHQLVQHDPDLHNPANYRVRSADRTDSAIPCTISRPEQPDMAGEVQNLSPGGSLLASMEPLPPDAFLTLKFEGADPVSAQVKWTDGGHCGCRFVRTLTVRQYLRIRQGADFEGSPPRKAGLVAKLRSLLPGKA